MVLHLADMEMVPPVFQNIIDYLHPMAHKRLARSIFGKLILAASSYFVWLERNARLFKNVKHTLEEIKDVIMVTVRLKLLTFKFKDSASLIDFLVWKLGKENWDVAWLVMFFSFLWGMSHIASDDVEQTVDDKVSDAGRPPHTDADENQADAASKIPKKDRFKETPRSDTHDPDWNTVKIVGDTLKQSWFNEMVQAKKTPLTFDELMSTPIDFSAFAMNRLKLNKITRADLVGLVFNLLKSTCKSYVESKYNMEECYRALTNQLDWANPKGYKSPVDMSKPLPLVEDVQLGVESYQRKLNSTKPQHTCQHILVKEPYTPNYDPPGIIYEGKSKNKRLMRLDEIHKFYDGTL
nr:RNA-directed DNA polymerase, eukaryota, reverse transcriptase zinc-binding domain protein [Tanacetum cinerariifolium]